MAQVSSWALLLANEAILGEGGEQRERRELRCAPVIQLRISGAHAYQLLHTHVHTDTQALLHTCAATTNTRVCTHRKRANTHTNSRHILMQTPCTEETCAHT